MIATFKWILFAWMVAEFLSGGIYKREKSANTNVMEKFTCSCIWLCRTQYVEYMHFAPMVFYMRFVRQHTVCECARARARVFTLLRAAKCSMWIVRVLLFVCWNICFIFVVQLVALEAERWNNRTLYRVIWIMVLKYFRIFCIVWVADSKAYTLDMGKLPHLFHIL